MTSGGKRRRQAAILEIVRKQRVPHEEAVRTGDQDDRRLLAGAYSDGMDAPSRRHRNVPIWYF